ncbi:FHA domain-containing protein [Sorangium sp. So ce726]|uniref:FHA domain-containing protein n=1 Tax=Sorangium sp. So ce726 TaxID=3133319 RepID=UPI003F644667
MSASARRGRRGGKALRCAPLLALAAAILALLAGQRRAEAAPESHILRIDPRASTADGSPVLTTVLEVVQNKRLSDITRNCAALTGDANLDCVADALEQPSALYSSFDFPDKNAILSVTVDGTDLPAKFESKARWGDSAGQPGVGTAWLILIDAASSMGNRFDEAKAVASAFVNAMQPNDIVDVMFFNDRGIVEDSKWVSNKQAAAQSIAGVARTYPTQGRTRPLFTIIKNAATDAFKELGNAGQGVTVPMHQAMVVLSNGSAGADPTSNAAASNELRKFLTAGRFENNDVLPKTPVPIISIWFPSRLVEEFSANSREFMEAMANTEIGGFFSVVRDGQQRRAANLVNAIRTRFNKMHIVKWRVSCVAPSMTQTFKLAFINTDPPIAGDATFQNVPLGVDPTAWPLDIDREATDRAAKKTPLYPGGTVKIFGNFCWGGNAQRAEIYMLPKNQAAPQSLQGGNLEDAKKAQRTLIEAGMRGKAITAGDSVVEFELPGDTDKFLVGKGDQMTARLVIYDNQARRTSAVTADKILTLKAKEAPLPYLLIGGVTFGGVVIVLLLVSIFRGGGKRRGGTVAAAPPRPIVAGSGPPPPYAPAPPPPGDFGYGGGPMMGPPMGGASRATLSGPAGIFTVHPGAEVRAGRDGASCLIALSEPRVSGTHASVKLEAGQLFVRDENSNNGTYVNGQRIAAAVWTLVPPGASLRFGPVEFSVRLE